VKLSIKVASTSQTVNVFIQDSSSTTGAGLTGLVFNTAGLTAYYALPKAAAVQITLATLAAITTAYSSGGFKEVDATNMPGWYRLDLPDAALASGRFVSVHLKGATNMAPLALEIELTAVDNQDAAAFGLSRIDAAITSRLAPTVAARTLDVSAGGEAGIDWANVGTPATAVDLSGTTIKTTQKVDVDTIKTNPVVNAGTITFPTNKTLTSTDLLPAALTANGNIKSSFVELITTALTEGAAGRLKAAFTTFFNVAAPVATTASVDQTGDNYARLGAPAGASIAADIASVKTDTGTTIPNLIAALNNLSAAQVKTQVVAALDTDTYAQPGQATPAATTTLTLMVRYLYKAWRNKATQTATEYDLYNDDAATVDQKASFSDDGTTATRGEIATGP
jgi:hypothetical protein